MYGGPQVISMAGARSTNECSTWVSVAAVAAAVLALMFAMAHKTAIRKSNYSPQS